jgi:hypothetical protein
MQILIAVMSIFCSHNAISQTKKNKCTTFVYNLTTGKMRIRDICFSIINTNHIDLNEFNPGKVRDNTQDLWKFSISIIDNDKKTQQSFEASFYVYEDNNEIKQYHCIVANSDFKAIIFDKAHNSWQILLLQDDEYKILSSYSGYHYTNAFGIKENQKSDINY